MLDNSIQTETCKQLGGKSLHQMVPLLATSLPTAGERGASCCQACLLGCHARLLLTTIEPPPPAHLLNWTPSQSCSAMPRRSCHRSPQSSCKENFPATSQPFCPTSSGGFLLERPLPPSLLQQPLFQQQLLPSHTVCGCSVLLQAPHDIF